MKKISNGQFKKFSAIVYNECGINLTEDKRELLNTRVSKRLRNLVMEADEYLSLIQKDQSEMKRFLDAVSTNHTFFFREAKSFKYLDHNCNTIWCAASSSGEEPYSIVTYCMDFGLRPSVLATDISETCLATAQRGIYSKERISDVPKHMLKSYFQKGHGKMDGYVRLKSEARKLIDFKRFNLIKNDPPNKIFDIIFCRNVMIYFDRKTKENVVSKLCRTLKPEGYFIIGGAESLSGLNHSLNYIEPSVYRK